MQYFQVSDFLTDARNLLQDSVSPYRYADEIIVSALGDALAEMSRLRPDIFLDLKYQQPLQKGDLGDGVPDLNLGLATNDFVPVPAKYYLPVVWYIIGYIQFMDVTDTQDQRAGAFMQKFQTILMTVAA